ncbi:efflux transporter outer membrane subunit [Chitinimonas sp. PSY-7]|uniref:efflux transporter outer membrane subunit n=1 Tax=Chitinimonas sp. PSY-7 TaxID=3459088 RepID=UPI00404002F6
MPPLGSFSVYQVSPTLLLGLLLTGCASVGPNYNSPQIQLAEQWQAALPHGGSTTTLVEWWHSFNDPTLSTLLRSAETDSPNLAKAMANIQAARAQQGVSDASALPSFNANAKISRAGTSKSENQDSTTTKSGMFDASWEIDLFGAVRRSQEAAQATTKSKEASWHDARVSLAAEVASEYVRYRACQLLTTTYQDNLHSLEQTAHSTVSAVDAGLTPPADASLAQASVANAKAGLTQQQAECDLSIKSLVTLTGITEPALRKQLAADEPVLPQPANLIVTSVPLQLLSQRPDLVSTERQLAAASAQIGQAEANRYPRLSLLGSISLTRTQSNGKSLETAPWSFGPSLNLPLFDGGASKAKVREAEANYASSLATYQQAVRTAVQEVEQAMVRLDSASQREASIATSAAGYRHYFTASEQLWQAGGSSLLNLEQRRREALGAEQSLITVRRDRVLYGIALYKALGGGWQAGTDAPSSTIGTSL